jgi:hypothetical protein
MARDTCRPQIGQCAREAVCIGFGLRFHGYRERVANGFSPAAPAKRMEDLMRVGAPAARRRPKLIRPEPLHRRGGAGIRGAEEE